MRYAVGLGFTLFGVWLLLSGHLEPLLLCFGVASCAFVVWLVGRMNVIDREAVPFHLAPRAATYLPWLLWQILKSNVAVARAVLHPRTPVSPRLIRVRASQADDFGRVIFANSITLTPGTVALRVHASKIAVHALTRDAAEDLQSGEMDRRVRAAVDPR